MSKIDHIRTRAAWDSLPSRVQQALEEQQGSRSSYWKREHYAAAEQALTAIIGQPMKLLWYQGENPANGLLVAQQAQDARADHLLNQLASLPPVEEEEEGLVPEDNTEFSEPALGEQKPDPLAALLAGNTAPIASPPANTLPPYLQSIGAFQAGMLAQGYTLRQREGVSTFAALRRWKATGSPCCILALGKPGTGKTFLFETLANLMGAQYAEFNCNAWTTDEPLLLSVNVNRFAESLAASQVMDIDKIGFITWIAQRSQEGLVVACLDELDKAPEEAESLLLRFLENGRVNLGEGKIIQANLANLIVGATSNQYRPHQEATLRRFSPRITMEFLPPDVEEGLIVRTLVGTGIPKAIHQGLAAQIVKLGNDLRGLGHSSPSLKEFQTCAQDLEYCGSEQDVTCILEGDLGKEPEELTTIQQYAGPIWKLLDRSAYVVEKPVAERKRIGKPRPARAQEPALGPARVFIPSSPDGTKQYPEGLLLRNKYAKACEDTGVHVLVGNGFALRQGGKWVTLTANAVAARLAKGAVMFDAHGKKLG